MFHELRRRRLIQLFWCIWFTDLFPSEIPLLILCFDNLSIGDKAAFKSPSFIVLKSIWHLITRIFKNVCVCCYSRHIYLLIYFLIELFPSPECNDLCYLFWFIFALYLLVIYENNDSFLFSDSICVEYFSVILPSTCGCLCLWEKMCKQHIVGPVFFLIYSANLCLLSEELCHLYLLLLLIWVCNFHPSWFLCYI